MGRLSRAGVFVLATLFLLLVAGCSPNEVKTGPNSSEGSGKMMQQFYSDPANAGKIGGGRRPGMPPGGVPGQPGAPTGGTGSGK